MVLLEHLLYFLREVEDGRAHGCVGAGWIKKEEYKERGEERKAKQRKSRRTYSNRLANILLEWNGLKA